MLRSFIGPGLLGLVFVLGLGCARSGTDANTPTTGEAAASEAVAPIEAEPPSNVAPEPVDPSLCVLPSYEQWAKCEGTRIQVDGRKPGIVQPHPRVDGPMTKQSYLDVEGGGQIIVETREAVTCEGAMRVVGTLHSVEGGSSPGAPASYRGWVIEDASVTCR